MEDYERYLPIRPRILDRVFKEYDIAFSMEGRCSWENYMEYIKIADSIKALISSSYDVEYKLLDAQSFLWILGMDDFVDFKSQGVRSKVKNKKTNAAENAKLVDDLRERAVFKYVEQEKTGEKVLRKKERYVNGNRTYPRNRQTAANALVLAGHKCEMDMSHRSFARKKAIFYIWNHITLCQWHYRMNLRILWIGKRILSAFVVIAIMRFIMEEMQRNL